MGIAAAEVQPREAQRRADARLDQNLLAAMFQELTGLSFTLNFSLFWDIPTSPPNESGAAVDHLPILWSRRQGPGPPKRIRTHALGRPG